MIWVWIAGGMVLAASAAGPLVVRRHHARQHAYVEARDRTHALFSELEQRIDAADAEAWQLAAARRYFTLAESALAGKDTLRGFRHADKWAREGLAALPAPEAPGAPGAPDP